MGRTIPEREEARAWEVGLRTLHQRIGGRFGRREPRQRALTYLKGLLGSVERKNGWQLAEYAGDATPDGVQRLLATYRWDADVVRDDLREYVVEHLGDPEAVLVVDETGVSEAGQQIGGGAAAVQWHGGEGGELPDWGVFWPTAARVDAPFWIGSSTCRRSGRRTGSAGGKLACPRRWSFRTKGQLAQTMIARVQAADVPFGWVAGDTVYGNDRRLRRWLEEQDLSYVLAVKSNEPLGVDTERGIAQVAARQLAQQIPEGDWQRLSAGEGSKGPRLYDWGRVSIRPWSDPDQSHWLLVRRSIADPG